MKDKRGTEIKVGDELLVVDGIDGFISGGGTYEVEGLREEEGRVVITDDRKLEGWYRADRFYCIPAEDR